MQNTPDNQKQKQETGSKQPVNQPLIRYLIIALVLFSCGQTMAQLKVLPLRKDTKDLPKRAPSNHARTAEETPLNLPFWDDFSFTTQYPADTLWQNSDHVFINDGLAINPPSLGVASFDGLNASGNAYGLEQSETGKTDSLTSRPIDLSSFSVESNVYVSFFYQNAGTGEGPDSGDSLRLEFKNSNNVWVSVWPGTNALNRTGVFTQVIKKIDDPSFFHDHFQFRFQSYGLRSGPYDIWNIDYVYMNKNRSETDSSVPDRTINVPLTSFLKDYTAAPYYHFSITDTIHPTFGIANLNTAGQPLEPIDYTITTTTSFIKEGSSLPPFVDSYAVPDPAEGPFPHGLESAKIVKLPNVFRNIAGQDADTAIVDIKVFLNSGDNAGDYDPLIYAPIDFRMNDTTRASFMLSNYYAYDDASAEYAAALNASGTSIAYKYQMIKDTTDHIIAVDIYFPYVGTDPAGKSINLTIWQSIAEQLSGKTLTAHQETVTVRRDPDLNSFVRYPLKQSIAVTDSFYIGYRQNTSGYLGIGLDKNTDSGNKIYYNLDGTWQQNSNVSGSLMMRPVFGAPADTLTTGIIDHPEELAALKVYPNPSTGLFKLEGDFQHLKVYDLRGSERKVLFIATNRNETLINLQDQPAGVYILKFLKDGNWMAVKLIKQD